jgi:hypothetical protein
MLIFFLEKFLLFFLVSSVPMSELKEQDFMGEQCESG